MLEMLRPSAKFDKASDARLAALARVAQSGPHIGNGIRKLSRIRAGSFDQHLLDQLQKTARSEPLSEGASHLSYRPFEWFWPTEPQLVFALVDQLAHHDSKVKLARINAFLAALSKAADLSQGIRRSASPPLLVAVDELAAEKITLAGKRIDLFIAGRVTDGPFEALVEVKLGHSITPGQLQSYTSDIRGCTPENTLLVVTAPQLTKNDADHIRKANMNRPKESVWGFIDLRTLLLELAINLPVLYDDEEFARVRRSLQAATERWL